VEALEMAEKVVPDLVLLDIRMPRMDGFQTCLRMRQNERTRHIPIIFLTTHNEPQTESFGLDLGADDFVTKPFDTDVLRARVKKRLNGGRGGSVGERTNLGDYVIHWERQEATHGDETIVLTTKEINLLRLFVHNAGRVLSREVILEKIWADTFITDRTIDSHVKELRKKLPPLVKLLKTVYGSGYRLDI
jgi:DNA-binding response OmpR family regulator